MQAALVQALPPVQSDATTHSTHALLGPQRGSVPEQPLSFTQSTQLLPLHCSPESHAVRVPPCRHSTQRPLLAQAGACGLGQSAASVACEQPRHMRDVASHTGTVPPQWEALRQATQRPLLESQNGRTSVSVKHQKWSASDPPGLALHGLHVPSVVSQNGLLESVHSADDKHATQRPVAVLQKRRAPAFSQCASAAQAWHSFWPSAFRRQSGRFDARSQPASVLGRHTLQRSFSQ